MDLRIVLPAMFAAGMLVRWLITSMRWLPFRVWCIWGMNCRLGRAPLLAIVALAVWDWRIGLAAFTLLAGYVYYFAIVNKVSDLLGRGGWESGFGPYDTPGYREPLLLAHLHIWQQVFTRQKDYRRFRE